MALQIFSDKYVQMRFWPFIHAKASQSSQHEDRRHVCSIALSFYGQGLLRSSSRAISVAGRSSRNPYSVSGTFLRVQSKRDRLLSGLPKTSTYARGFHPRPTNFLPFTNLPLPTKSFTVTHSNFLQT